VNEDQEKEVGKEVNAYVKYGGLAIQMGAVIGLSCWLGVFLDKKMETETPWWTIGLSLFGISASLYLVLREVLKSGK
jgi:ATP synthase protein I